LPLPSAAVPQALESVRTRLHREMLSRLDLRRLEQLHPDALRA